MINLTKILRHVFNTFWASMEWNICKFFFYIFVFALLFWCGFILLELGDHKNAWVIIFYFVDEFPFLLCLRFRCAAGFERWQSPSSHGRLESVGHRMLVNPGGGGGDADQPTPVALCSLFALHCGEIRQLHSTMADPAGAYHHHPTSLPHYPFYELPATQPGASQQPPPPGMHSQYYQGRQQLPPPTPPLHGTTFSYAPLQNSGRDEVRTLFIAGLPDDVKPREIYNLFREFPGYVSCQVRCTGQSTQVSC